MRVECAVLCDAASLREGLLHLLGAGITDVIVPSVDGGLPVTFAFRAVLESRELRSTHTLHLELTDSASGDAVAAVEVNFVRTEDTESGALEAGLAAPVPLQMFQVPRPGLYLLEATLDQRRLATLPLRVELLT
jgi:hypothetical protein